MDLSYDADIDTRCVGCGESAQGWTFASDGRRVYVCPDCAKPLSRYDADEDADGTAHPQAQFCLACDRLTLQRDLSHQKRCPDCRGAAGERQLAERETDNADSPPEVEVAQADAAGHIDWESEQDG